MAQEENPFAYIGQHASRNNGSDAPERLLNQGLDERERALMVQREIARAMPAVRSWRGEAQDNRNMYDNHQWDDHDRMVMEQTRRPALTYNEIKKVLRAVCGIERLNRTEVKFATKAIDSPLIEDLMGSLATEAVITIDELSDADKERSLIFLDVLIGGMGWMETYVSFAEDFDGQIMKERISPFEMAWDTNAKRSGIVDTRWRARIRKMPRKEFSRRWPGKLDLIDAAAEESEFKGGVPRYNLITPYYSLMNERANPQVADDSTHEKDTIEVIQFQERIEESVYRVPDPEKPSGLVEFSKDEYQELREEFEREGLPLPPTVRQIKTVHRQLYVAHGVELEEPTNLPGNRFSLTCMTGEWDEKRKMWIGMVPEMVDPQKTKNKSLSAALAFYLSNAKGGVLFESGAFVNEAQAKEQWSSPNPWIPVNADKLGKIQPRVPAEMPNSLQMFFEVGTRALTEVVGMNQELLGLAQTEAGGPTQRGRISAGLAILGWVFDEYDRFKKADAIVTLDFVRDFMTNGQLIEIGGEEAGKSIPLIKSNLPVKYKLTLDQSIRQNPNLKAQIWQDLMPIVPALLRFNAGTVLLSLLKFSPLPAQVVNDIRREVAKAAQQENQQGGGRGKQEPPELTDAKVKKTEAEAARAMAQAKSYDEQSKAKIAELFLQGFRLTSDIVNREADDEHRRQMDKAGLNVEDAKLEAEQRRWAVDVLRVLQEFLTKSYEGESGERSNNPETTGRNGGTTGAEQ